MYISCYILLIALTIARLARARTSYHSLLNQLTKTCPSDGIPVCAIRDNELILFSNSCQLNEVNEELMHGEPIFRKIPLHHCIYECQLSCTEMHEPVCAQKVKTYQNLLFRNQCKLTEYACKTNEEYLKISLSECLPKTSFKDSNKLLEKRSQEEMKRRPIPCINVFKPVCGSYMGVKSSFKNECFLNAENIVFNKDWRIVQDGLCPQDNIKSRRHKVLPAKLHPIEKRSYENNFYNLFQHEHEYSGNDFVANKNRPSDPSSNLYVYMPPTFHTTQYLSHEDSSYQNSMPVHEGYDDILKKMASPLEYKMSISAKESKEEIEEPLSEKSNILSHLPIMGNKVNFEYLPDQNFVHDTKQQSIPLLAINSLISEENKDYNDYELENLEATKENESIEEMPTTTTTAGETTEIPTTIASEPQVLNERKQLKEEKEEEIVKESIECKLGSVALCATTENGTVRTFKTVCDMTTANVKLENNTQWAKLHEGVCEDCKYNCSGDYRPVCVTKNGMNYTMVNECFYNIAICMDKMSKWQLLSNAECERCNRIPDKYANSEPGFPYTSNYFVTETTEMPSTDSLPIAGTSAPLLKVKFSKNKNTNSKKNINRSRRLSSHKCCSETDNTEQNQEDNIECDCRGDTTQVSSETLSLQGPQTESYVMRLVKDKDNSIDERE